MVKVNLIKCIKCMQIAPKEASRFDIPLCRMVYLPLMRPKLDSNIKRLEAEVAYGFRVGATIF
jgi:hypothetical protein